MSPIDDNDDEIQAALYRSLQPSSGNLNTPDWSEGLDRKGLSPVAKRSKSDEKLASINSHQQRPMASSSTHVSQQASTSKEDQAAQERRKQRELRAAAAEKRMQGLLKASQPVQSLPDSGVVKPQTLNFTSAARVALGDDSMTDVKDLRKDASGNLAEAPEANGHDDKHQAGDKGSCGEDDALALFGMVFGCSPPPQTLSQWTNQGFRFSEDAETSLGLVQKEGGPCGVLAPVQALVLKHLLFGEESRSKPGNARENEILEFTSEQSQRALVCAMAETLWVAGGLTTARLALVESATVPVLQSLTSPSGLQSVLIVAEYHSLEALRGGIQQSMALFQSGVGALLMLFSLLLSRTLAQVQTDRDDPSLPLVTEPFGHASQEIVNLLLCGHAVPNVFDGVMDLGGGMALKGIPEQTDVGFLTLLESLNLCKVGENLKKPRLPIWVVGSESHYTVLFALDEGVQEEESSEEKEEKRVREAFDKLDTSGGGGFITPEALDQLSSELGFELSAAVKEELGGGMGVIVWQELWKALLRLESSKGGLKHIAEATANSSQKQRKFNLYHFNGIAKRVLNANSHRLPAVSLPLPNGDVKSNEQRPKLTKIWVSVPPKWTPNECMAIQPYTVSDLNLTMAAAADSSTTTQPQSSSGTSLPADVCESTVDTSMFDNVQHAPLADCIRTRWPRATCGWEGDAPSIV